MSSGGAITPQFLVDFETRMDLIRENEYARLAAAENLWWDVCTSRRTTVTKRDIISLLFQSAQIKELGSAGKMRFEQLAAHYTEIETEYAGTGFKISRDQLEDVYNGVAGGEALDLAAEWNIQTGAQMAYWPQEKVAEFLKNAHQTSYAVGYDDKAYFATDHPVHPLAVNKGTYSNLLSGAGTYAIHGSDDAVALENLKKVFAHVRKFKMPNGKQPRFLRPRALLVNSTMYPRVTQLLQARFIAKDTGSGAGSVDMTGFVQSMGFGQVIECPELNDFESDTTYFVVLESIGTSNLGAVIYTERRPFEMNNYGPMSEADLARRQEFEWHCRGKNSVSPGHPYLLLKVKAT